MFDVGFQLLALLAKRFLVVAGKPVENTMDCNVTLRERVYHNIMDRGTTPIMIQVGSQEPFSALFGIAGCFASRCQATYSAIYGY